MKDVADAMEGKNPNASYMSRRQSMTINNSRMSQAETPESKRYGGDIPSHKMPSALVNQDKLKIVLQQLKKAERNALHTSRW